MPNTLSHLLTDTLVVIVGVVLAELAMDVIRRARKRRWMRHLNRLSVASRRAKALSQRDSGPVSGAGR